MQKQLKAATDQLAIYRQLGALDRKDPAQARQAKQLELKLAQFANPISTSPVGGPPAPLPAAPSVSAPAQAAPVAGSTASTAGAVQVDPGREQWAQGRMRELLNFLTPEQAKIQLEYEIRNGRGPTGRYLGDGPE